MSTYVEIHALQTVPPSCINRDDTGAPKSAIYGGVHRARVSSQSWKRAIREDFNQRLDPKDIGTRSTQIASEIAKAIVALDPTLSEQAINLAADAMEASGFKRPVSKSRGKNKVAGDPETGYLVFLSQRQIEALAAAAVEASADDKPLAAMKSAKVKSLVNADHSVDIALFGRMIADSTDLNVDAACQVAHALSVHEASTEYDFYTAVDDARDRDDSEEDAGAGMMGTVGFLSATLYRYAAVNMDQLNRNLGSSEASSRALKAFVQGFIESMPTGKINTFANGTRPAVVLVTVAEGQPTSLVEAFEEPVRAEDGHLKPAIARLATHANEVFETWRRPRASFVVGLPSLVGDLDKVGRVVSIDDLYDALRDELSESE